ncbi:hypothetical protein D9M69_349540 [compost metagenome]
MCLPIYQGDAFPHAQGNLPLGEVVGSLEVQTVRLTITIHERFRQGRTLIRQVKLFAYQVDFSRETFVSQKSDQLKGGLSATNDHDFVICHGILHPPPARRSLHLST